MLQAPMLDRLSFDPFTLLDDGWCPAEVGVGGRHVVQALVVALVIVVLDEGLDLGLEIAGQEVVLQQDAVFQGLVPALDLALGLGMARCTDRRARYGSCPRPRNAGEIDAGCPSLPAPREPWSAIFSRRVGASSSFLRH